MLIVIATHKEKPVVHNKIMIPIEVGAHYRENEICNSFLKDNTGDNISEKNPTYNELSAMYWMWKNAREQDIVGLMHYRRFFNFFENPLSLKPSRRKWISGNHKLIQKTNQKDDFIEKKIHKLLSKYEVILTRQYIFKVNDVEETIYEVYKSDHYEKDFKIMEEVILEKYPEYKESMRKYFYEEKLFYFGNMFISKFDWFDKFAQFNFDILFEIEKRVDLTGYDGYQRRIFGFLGERLHNLYIYHNKPKLLKLQVLMNNDFDYEKQTHAIF